MTKEKLNVIDSETLVDMRLPPQRFCVQTLLPQGMSILGGAGKIGKLWLVLDLCIRVAKGEPLWNFPTTKGTTLYLCLEDTFRRVQDRLVRITDDWPDNAFFTVAAKTLADGLCDQIRDFLKEHPDTVLVAIDVFQMIRGSEKDNSYATDYHDIQLLKEVAVEFDITILVVHHVRKLDDDDPFNTLSGTTGISGAVDTSFVLKRSNRNEMNATLCCTGRDIESRELELKFNKDTCTWELLADSMEEPTMLLPKEMAALIEFMRETVSFSGNNTVFAEAINAYAGLDVKAKGLKQMMNTWRYTLEDHGVHFRSYRSNGQRLLDISFSEVKSDVSDSNDGNISGGEISVICDPCVPVGKCEPHSAAVSALHAGSEETLTEGTAVHDAPQNGECATS